MNGSFFVVFLNMSIIAILWENMAWGHKALSHITHAMHFFSFWLKVCVCGDFLTNSNLTIGCCPWLVALQNSEVEENELKKE